MQHSFSENFSYMSGTTRVGTGCVSIIFPESSYTSAQALQRGITLATWVKSCGSYTIGDDDKIHFSTLGNNTTTSTGTIHTTFICKRVGTGQSEPKFVQFDMDNPLTTTQAQFISSYQGKIETITGEQSAAQDYIIVSAVIMQ